ncbi:MAG: thiamine pyrophosphate-binding protein [Oscillospiraceae bacterium]
MKMKVSDYIVLFLIQKKVTDVFCYPGGMITHLMDSFHRYGSQIKSHTNYHEQGSSFCACGYAQTKRLPTVALASSGPGAVNLISGILNAYCDSLPAIFITGEVNTYECKGDLLVRQRGFQEADIIPMVDTITKYAVKIKDVNTILYHLEKAYYLATTGRPGSVLLDIPMDIQRMEIEVDTLKTFTPPVQQEQDDFGIAQRIISLIQSAKRPCIIAGAGIQAAGVRDAVADFIKHLKIPVVTSMLGIDVLSDKSYDFGFIGTYGHRSANFIISKSDCIVSIGSRLDIRQIGSDKQSFAPNAKLIRIDIDTGELTNRIKEEEIQIVADIKTLVPMLAKQTSQIQASHEEWLGVCNDIKKILNEQSNTHQISNDYIKELSALVPDGYHITTDVGQNQVWVAQSFDLKPNQRLLFGGGHAAMGYSLPAAIGAYYGDNKPVICFNGDGGLQMNMQELQFIIREKLPIKIIILNNNALGMIRHFQEMYFDANYVQSIPEGGYTVPDFKKIADSYDIPYKKIAEVKQVGQLSEILSNPYPAVIEILLPNNTYVFPKLVINKPIYDQEPALDAALIKTIMDM